MANDHFSFKQFKIVQGHSAMKVGTDGVVLGAWCSVPAAGVVGDNDKNKGSVPRVLDIGCGTGLISLMVAQRSGAALIDAIDIDSGAVGDAGYNFKNSPWSGRLYSHEISLQDYADKAADRYGHIVSNPPYFSNSLLPPDPSRSMARHTGALTYGELIKGVDRLLSPDGIFSVILPAGSAAGFERIAAASGLFVFRRLDIVPKPDSAVKRAALEFSRTEGPVVHSLLVIETGERHSYSDEYRELTREFYLDF